jgi:hypothetical protein
VRHHRFGPAVVQDVPQVAAGPVPAHRHRDLADHTCGRRRLEEGGLVPDDDRPMPNPVSAETRRDARSLTARSSVDR